MNPKAEQVMSFYDAAFGRNLTVGQVCNLSGTGYKPVLQKCVQAKNKSRTSTTWDNLWYDRLATTNGKASWTGIVVA